MVVLKNAREMRYVFPNGWRYTEGGNWIEIYGKQYYGAVKIIEERGSWIPDEKNPNGNNFKDREFFMGRSLIKLSGGSEIRKGGTRTIDIFSDDFQHLRTLAEELDLPLPIPTRSVLLETVAEEP